MQREQEIIKMYYIKHLRRYKHADFSIHDDLYFESHVNKDYIYTKLTIGDHVITYYTKSENQAWEQPIQWLVENGYLERDDWI